MVRRFQPKSKIETYGHVGCLKARAFPVCEPRSLSPPQPRMRATHSGRPAPAAPRRPSGPRECDFSFEGITQTALGSETHSSKTTPPPRGDPQVVRRCAARPASTQPPSPHCSRASPPLYTHTRRASLRTCCAAPSIWAERMRAVVGSARAPHASATPPRAWPSVNHCRRANNASFCRWGKKCES